MALLIQETGDGSHTLFSEEYNEIYHSRRGAWQESLHVFIEMGLIYLAESQTDIKILEIGFGTGLNAIMTLQKAEELSLKIDYHSLETIPVSLEIIEQLNYPKFLEAQEMIDLFRQMHQKPWNERILINSLFCLSKYHVGVQDFNTDQQFDLIYFDAFAPSKQSEMWDISIFEKIRTWMKPGAVLVTYSSKGQLKRDLQTLNFEVQNLPGPPGKREMTRAIRLGTLAK